MILLGFRIHAIGSIYRTNIIHMTTFMSQRINIIYIKLGLAWLCAKVDVLLVLASRMRERERERDGGSWPKYHITAQCNSMFAGYIDNLFISI